jgi:hypothetical protein
MHLVAVERHPHVIIASPTVKIDTNEIANVAELAVARDGIAVLGRSGLGECLCSMIS